MNDPRYEVPVNGLSPKALAKALNASVDDVAKRFPPHTGVCVFVFDFGAGGGIGYAANADRADMVKALREWLNKQASLS